MERESTDPAREAAPKYRMIHPDHSSSREVLPVVDRMVLVAVPVMIFINVLRRPEGPSLWVAMFGVLLAALGLLAVLGRMGHAPWRGAVFPVVVLAGGVVALWSNGPLGGVGVVLGGATLLAGVLLSRRGLIIIMCLGVVAIGIRMAFAVGAWSSAEEGRSLRFSEFSLWLKVAIGVGVLLWITSRILKILFVSLGQAYERAADALRIEQETQQQLVSSRQQLEEIEEVQLVGRLAGGVAHDVNNALTAILAASEVLGDELTTDHQRKQLFEIEAASQHAAELVRDLLWIGRKLPPATVAADLEATVSACRSRLERMARTIAFDVQLDRSLRVAIGPDRLEQLLFWLFLGAHRSGVTQLALTGHRDGAVVEIGLRGLASTGSPSTSLDVRPKAVRAKLSTSATKELVEQAGGSLTTKDDGGLLHVVIRLPLVASESPRRERPPGEIQTALVVEDEPLVLNRLARLIARRGYRVMTASSLAEAWPLLGEDPDLLVTDLQLGDGRGEELAITSFERNPERPIIVCSGFGADDALRERLREAHFTFLAKPFTRTELEEVIPRTGKEAE